MSKFGILYIVPTPIGNLGDMTHRAVEVLSSVDLIACEDTRHTAPLLRHFGVETPTVSLHSHNESIKSENLLGRLKAGVNIAVVSDAGTPLIHDPGYELVVMAREHDVQVVPLPGACALIAALSVSGLASDRFMFEGFLPSKSVARKKILEECRYETQTVIFYETPHRILASLKDMAEVFGPLRHAVVARELTKLHEDIFSGPLEELIALVESDPNKQKGEFVVLVKGFSKKMLHDISVSDESVLKPLLSELPLKQAVSLAVKITGHQKNHLYDLALTLK